MKKTAFTLIELLVVISVITVLMAVLLPALSRVRKVARAMRCLSNARQVGLALHSGADDTGGLVLPAYNPPWWQAPRDYCDSNDTFLCPEARKPGPPPYVQRTPYEAWDGFLAYPDVHFACSYGVSGWLVGTQRLRDLAKTWGWEDIEDFRVYSRRHWYWTGHNLSARVSSRCWPIASAGMRCPKRPTHPPNLMAISSYRGSGRCNGTGTSTS